MAKSDFFSNVHTAVASLTPRSEEEDPFSQREDLERALLGTRLWLTPEAVEGFDGKDFDELPDRERAGLVEHVERFRSAAKGVPPQGAVSAQQVQDALREFVPILGTVGRMMREEWVQSARAILDEAEDWARARDWPCKRYPKRVSEALLGVYALERLVFAASGSQLVLVPVGRFVVGADGMFDLANLPDYESVKVVRLRGHWHIEPADGGEERQAWSEAAFVENAEKLARLA